MLPAAWSSLAVLVDAVVRLLADEGVGEGRGEGAGDADQLRLDAVGVEGLVVEAGGDVGEETRPVSRLKAPTQSEALVSRPDSSPVS